MKEVVTVTQLYHSELLPVHFLRKDNLFQLLDKYCIFLVCLGLQEREYNRSGIFLYSSCIDTIVCIVEEYLVWFEHCKM